MGDFPKLVGADAFSAVLSLGITSLLVLFAARRHQTADARRLWVIAGLYTAYVILNHSIGVTVQQSVGLTGLRFNWTGKLLAIALGLTIIRLTPSASRGAHPFGWTFQLKPNTRGFAMALIVFAVGIRIALALASPVGPFSVEELLFEATLPGIAEEMWHRSILLRLLDDVFPVKRSVLGASMGLGVVATSLLFGLEHGLVVTPGSFAVGFNASAFARTAVTGLFIYGLLRERTGSVVPSIVAHNLSNAVSPLVAALRP